ncbi:MAG: hypothetical protein M3239_03260 [Thermoproteota archaeon]|nr:hypothetical protein [Thermoproteota archaeon]
MYPAATQSDGLATKENGQKNRQVAVNGIYLWIMALLHADMEPVKNHRAIRSIQTRRKSNDNF